MSNIGLWNPGKTEFKEYFRYKVVDIIPENKIEYIVLCNNEFLVVYRESISGRTGKLLQDQFELPLKALDLVLLNIARLPLPPEKGGYKDGRWGTAIYLSKDIDLYISYRLSHRVGQYCFDIDNRVARSYICKYSKQDITWYVKTLNENGLLAKLVEINDLYKDGKL